MISGGGPAIPAVAWSGRASFYNRLEQLLAITQPHAELLEVGFGEFAQDVEVDRIVTERLLVALQPQLLQPSPDVHSVPHGDGARMAKATRVTDRRPPIRSRPPPE